MSTPDDIEPVAAGRARPPRRPGRGVADPSAGARTKLLGAALKRVREKGFAATTVDELCADAAVTKGAFFHHFPSKEALGVAAARHWSDTTGAFFAAAPYHGHADPLARLLGYIDFRAGLIDGPIEAFTCVAGTMVQEQFLVSPAIRDACGESICGHAAHLEADITAAMRVHGVTGIDAKGLALHIQAVLQGGFVLAKAANDPALARASVEHLRRYIALLFAQGGSPGAADPDRPTKPSKRRRGTT